MADQQRTKIPLRFYSLDSLRGFAALSVVFWHWQHFFYVGSRAQGLDIERLPFAKMAYVFYTTNYAVQLFFTLSGFVFYWLYAEKIRHQALGFGRFALLRISRLYPLHLLTLLVVALGQWVHHRFLGDFFIYQFNDAYHFVLNLLFASSWGLELGYSFNAPIWSVSVEILLYGFFFALCRLIPVSAVVPLVVAGMAYLWGGSLSLPIAEGITSFFIGGCSYFVYRWVLTSKYSLTLTWTVSLLAASGWLIAIAAVYSKTDIMWVPARISQLVPIYFLFPETVLVLALIETQCGTFAKATAWLGDISYSIYLWHFPLQLFFAICFACAGISRSIYYSPGFMLAFFALLIMIAFASHYRFERPIQRFLRSKASSSTSERGQETVSAN